MWCGGLWEGVLGLGNSVRVCCLGGVSGGSNSGVGDKHIAADW